MATWYLNADTGNDTTGTGAIGAPYKTFAKALTVYAANDTIYFQNSVAYYTFVTAVIDKACTIRGQSKEGVVLDGRGAIVNWNTKNATIAIEELTIYNAYTGGTYYGLISPSANTSNTNITVQECIFLDCHIQNHSLAGVFGHLAIGANTTVNFTVHRCKFVRHELLGSNSTFLSMRTGVSTAIYNFVMTECTADIKATATGYFYYLDNLAGGTVTQNIKNCIFTVRSGSMNWRNIFGSSTFTCTYTTIYGVTSVHSSITSQPGVSQTDPLLVDPDNGNLNLRQSSTKIDAGTDL